MAITTPTSLQVPSAYETMLPKMARQPLQKVLEDLNYLYCSHRPALASVCLSTAGAIARTTKFIIPITPSADGFKYGFESRIYCSTACNLSIVIDYCTAYSYDTSGPWTNIIDHTGVRLIAVAGAGLVTQVDTGVIPATAVALRLQFSVSAGNHTPHHFLTYPKPDAPTPTVYPSGFVLFDDGLLSSGQHSPIHTELLNRCKTSADVVRRDRWQCLFSWAQEEPQASAAVVLSNVNVLTAFPRVRCWLPGQALTPAKNITVKVFAIVTTDDTSTGTAKVQLSQVETGNGIYFDAERAAAVTLQSTTMQLATQGTDTMRYVELELSGMTAVTKKTYIHSLVVLWRPGD